MKDPAKDASGYPIAHGEMRFRKIIEIPTRPRAGDVLELNTRGGELLPATVMRVDLDESRELFVLSCQFGRRMITRREYDALADDPDWELKHLLEP